MSKTTNKSSNKSVDLGALQSEFELSTKNWHSSEKALARAQELRNAAKKRVESADTALRVAAQSVLG